MSHPDGPTAYDISECRHLAEIAPEPFTLGTATGEARALRRLPDGAPRSAMVTFPAGAATGGALRTATVLQAFVRGGSIRLGGRTLGADAFCVVPAGGVLPLLEIIEAATLLLIQDEGQVLTPVASGDDAIVTPDMYGITPITPVIAGRPLTGFERRVLWLDAATGADTRLLKIPAGFRGTAGPNWHPVQEEIFCLEGDIEPDPSRPMRAGSFLWNPARSVHGFGEQSLGGCTLLEWHDGDWAFHAWSGDALAVGA